MNIWTLVFEKHFFWKVGGGGASVKTKVGKKKPPYQGGRKKFCLSDKKLANSMFFRMLIFVRSNKMPPHHENHCIEKDKIKQISYILIEPTLTKLSKIFVKKHAGGALVKKSLQIEILLWHKIVERIL